MDITLLSFNIGWAWETARVGSVSICPSAPTNPPRGHKAVGNSTLPAAMSKAAQCCALVNIDAEAILRSVTKAKERPRLEASFRLVCMRVDEEEQLQKNV